MDILAYEIKLTGIVQGVGFRPFVHRLAADLSLKGRVSNTGASVHIWIEGQRKPMAVFLERLVKEAPALSYIKDMEVVEMPAAGFIDFSIEESRESSLKKVYISPDASLCGDCARELLDSSDRRYRYPFINCTHCGPRFTIVTGIPYDRKNTTMEPFPMCAACRKEYDDPADRRYHAQPVACPRCGPSLKLLDRSGNRLDPEDPIAYVRHALAAGSIVAVKGLGGYHLACNAADREAVRKLRERKIRDDKPFALMVRDFETAGRYCVIDEAERKLLESPRKPIVLLEKRNGPALPEELAPGNPALGIMLPYTPLHLLLFHGGADGPDALVMTSGNRSNEPIYYKDGEALENLRSIADYFLTHDRQIHIRTDDSVTRIFRGKEYILRRSRGYVPMPVTCSFAGAARSVLACGGELKNTFCINRGNEFYLSHHIGDLENAETFASFAEGIGHFRSILALEAEAVAYDLHPEYLSTKYAQELALEHKIAVQHHHAHIASCMAENDLQEEVIGVALDGTGYGEDGKLWGGEFFSGSYRHFTREGHLAYVRLPGGEAAIREPWRMALSYLYSSGAELAVRGREEKGVCVNGTELLQDIEASKILLLLQVLEKGINSPWTSSMGRLFDAAAALIGIRSSIRYEGQAAIELEYACDRDCPGEYPFTVQNGEEVFVICAEAVLKGIMEDMKNNTPRGVMAAKFHETAANMVLEGCKRVRARTGLGKAVLSGGVFQNMTLLQRCVRKLEASGLKAYVHSRVPPNDGGIALGQAVIAAARLRDL